MTEINFSNIRSHDGSKEKGFEEFICHLASMSKPDNARYFVRKEGDGGDAGVECYWTLNDGSEHAWQAKYFMDTIENSQWQQISKSVETALEKHPNIRKYYICLPRDWTDSRSIRKGKKINSAFDKWKEYCESWKLLAQSKNMEVEFIYWCKHELTNMLHGDSSLLSGMRLYWFNEPCINSEALIDLANRSKESLGERFTPEFHIDLPITSKFDYIGMTPRWKARLEKEVINIGNIKNELKDLLSDCYTILSTEEIQETNDLIIMLHSKLVDDLEYGATLGNIDLLVDICNKISKKLYGFTSIVYSVNIEDKTLEESYIKKRRRLSSLDVEINGFISFLSDDETKCGILKAMLLFGEAGIGKSHLLCDIALKRLKEDLPTVFVLGQHYNGGNPLKFICEKLGLSQFTNKTVLGALDAFGKSKNSRTLIIVDAINEGPYRDEWLQHIVDFLEEVKLFPNVSLIISCRDTYKEYLIPEEILGVKITAICHNGFRGYEHEAALNYLAKQGISKASMPLLMPELSNPLFLKTCCKAIKSRGESQFPKGMNGFKSLYEFYMDSINYNIKKAKKYRTSHNIVLEVVNKFVEVLYQQNAYGVDARTATNLINEFDMNSNIGDTLFNLLIDEGLFAFDVEPDTNGGKGREIVRFSYERFSDYAIAEHILKQCKSDLDVAELFKSNGTIDSLLAGTKYYKYRGVIEALGLIIPEKFNKEFLEFVDINKASDRCKFKELLDVTFVKTILWRTGKSIGKKSWELLNEIDCINSCKKFDILLSLSTEPNHSWNAELLDKKLREYDMPSRDHVWSTYVAISDEYNNNNNIVRTLIDWAANASLQAVEPERLRLMALALLWMTTTSNRKTRDQTTKSLARVLCYIPEKIIDFIGKFNSCDDIYLVERLYAAIYGVVVRLNNNQVIKDIANCVYETQFKSGEPYPNILIRDYAIGIMEFAYSENLLGESIRTESFRPPYSSKWPIENPLTSEIDNVTGHGYKSAIRNSVIGALGDFGKYTMSCVRHWSATPIESANHMSGYELMQEFAKKLTPELRTKYEQYLSEKLQKENNRITNINNWLDSLQSNDLKTIWDNEEECEDKSSYDNLTEETETIFDEGDQEEESYEILLDELKKEIDAALNEQEKEEFRWLDRMFNIYSQPWRFSKQWCQRWVCKKAYDLGWKSELFSEFEQIYSNNRDYNRSQRQIERIGKKYQWIAFRELLARMADNLMWIDGGYSDVYDHEYFGAWQIDERDIDPTLWLRSRGNDEDKNVVRCWWQPKIFPFWGSNTDEQKTWLWDKKILPNFEEILSLIDDQEKQEWLVLRAECNQSRKSNGNDEDELEQSAWYRINSIIISKKDICSLKRKIKNKPLCDPYIVNVASNHQGYWGEYPWHPCYQNSKEDVLQNDEKWSELIIDVPISNYEWSIGGRDYSINRSISFYMPSSMLIEELSLIKNYDDPGKWVSKADELVFWDPSVMDKGESYALIRKSIFERWLADNDLMIVWLIGGEKELFSNGDRDLLGRLVFSGLYTMKKGDIAGELWFEEEKYE